MYLIIHTFDNIVGKQHLVNHSAVTDFLFSRMREKVTRIGWLKKSNFFSTTVIVSFSYVEFSFETFMR